MTLREMLVLHCLIPHRKGMIYGSTVIFEPLPKIKLTRSSYQVTTFLDFQPFLKGFNQVKAYIDKFIKDLNNPNYVYGVPMRIEIVELALTNDTELAKLLDSSGCKV